jgi:hypothetical protein
MSARSDFEVFTFNEHLGENQSDIDTGFTFRGQFSTAKVFEINQTPFGSDGYVEYQVSHVDELSHEILINGKALPAVDVFRTGQGAYTGLQTHTDVIPASFLKKARTRSSSNAKGTTTS